MANRAYYRQKNKQNNNKKKTLISTLKNFLFSLFNYLSLQKKKFIPDETISITTRDRHAPLAMTHNPITKINKIFKQNFSCHCEEVLLRGNLRFTVIGKINKTPSITWSSAIHCALLSLSLRGRSLASVIFKKIPFPSLRGGNPVLKPIYHKQQRNKLTASVLTFIFIFNSIIGIFSPINVFNFNKPQQANAAWFNENGNWLYRKSITIDHTKVSGDLTNFPVLISITDDSLRDTANGGKVTNSNGYDIIFTQDSSITQLSHEIEYYDNTTGELQAWVKIPSLSSTTDTVIYMYYDNSDITTSQENIPDVWDDNFKLVQHMNEDPSSSSPQMIDSTQYSNDGTTYGTMTTDDLISGQIDGATEFDGSDDYHSIETNGLDLLGSTSHTAGVWAKMNGNGTDGKIYWTLMNKNNSGNGYDDIVHLWVNNSANNEVTLRVGNGTIQKQPSAVGSMSDNNWHYITMTYDGARYYYLYFDGVLATTLDVGEGWVQYTNTNYLRIGEWSAYNNHFNGTIDEVRISNTARSSDWIATEYTNQSNPTEFYTLGIEEVYQAPLSNFSHRKAITIDHTKVSSDLANFPVLISLPTDDSLSSYAQTDADDILFTLDTVSWTTDSSNDRLAHEIEYYDNTTGQLQAWVNIPNLSSTQTPLSICTMETLP